MKTAFSRLSRKQQRIAIAKDVLERLKTTQYRPESGVWVEGHSIDDDSLQKHVTKGRACTVCALGGIIASYAFFANRLTFDSMGGVSLYATDSRISRVFGKDRLRAIEHAFERGGGAFDEGAFPDYKESSDGYSGESKTANRLRRFGERYDSDLSRFHAIFRNIVRNDGEFKV